MPCGSSLWPPANALAKTVGAGRLRSDIGKAEVGAPVASDRGRLDAKVPEVLGTIGVNLEVASVDSQANISCEPVDLEWS